MTKRVLIVEDDPLNRMLFCAWLESRACEVTELSDGRSVCETAQALNPDLIVMDINLPHVSGVTLIEALKSNPSLQHIPVLAVTGYAGKGEESRIREAGARDYLPKPVSHKTFDDAVERLLGS